MHSFCEMCRYTSNLSFLEVAGYNFISVDWNSLAQLALDIRKNTKDVGNHIADFIGELDNLYPSNSIIKSIHLIGASLGAQVLGYTGLSWNGTLPRITALDPPGTVI